MQVEHTSKFLFRYIKVVCLPICTQAAFLPCYTKGMLQKTKVMHLKKSPQLVQLLVNVELKVLSISKGTELGPQLHDFKKKKEKEKTTPWLTMKCETKSEVLSKKKRLKTLESRAFLKKSLIRPSRVRSCQAVFDKIRTDNTTKVRIQVDVLHNNDFSEAPKIFINTAIGRTILSQEGFLLVVCSWGQEAGTIVKALKHRQVPAFYSLALFQKLLRYRVRELPHPWIQFVRASEFWLSLKLQERI